MKLDDLLLMLKQRIEQGEDAEKVFEENKHLFKKAETDAKEFWKKSGKDEMYDLNIHIWRKPGMGNCVQMINGNNISILTGTMSLLQTIITNNIISKETLIEACQELLEEK